MKMSPSRADCGKKPGECAHKVRIALRRVVIDQHPIQGIAIGEHFPHPLAREKLVEGGPNWFPVGVSAKTSNINTTWPTSTSLNF